MHIGFIGLGQMGRPIAENILAAGHGLTVYNRTVARTRSLVEAGAELAATPLAAAEADLLLTMVTGDAALDQLFFEDGLIDTMPKTTLHVSMSTIGATCGKRLRDAHAGVGRPFVAAPVLGRPDRAAEALLFVFAAGNRQDVDRCVPVFESISQRWFFLGNDPQSAVVAKIANNFLLGCVIESMAQAYTICDAHGLSRREFFDAISATLFDAPAYSVYGRMMAEHQFLPPACPPAIGIKDMRLALEAAAGSGHDVPLARMVKDHLENAVANGLAERDWSVLGAEEMKWNVPS